MEHPISVVEGNGPDLLAKVKLDILRRENPV